MVSLWYLRGAGMIATISRAFRCDLCEFMVLGGLKGLLVDLCQHFLICALDDKMDYTITLILGW